MASSRINVVLWCWFFFLHARLEKILMAYELPVIFLLFIPPNLSQLTLQGWRIATVPNWMVPVKSLKPPDICKTVERQQLDLPQEAQALNHWWVGWRVSSRVVEVTWEIIRVMNRMDFTSGEGSGHCTSSQTLSLQFGKNICAKRNWIALMLCFKNHATGCHLTDYNVSQQSDLQTISCL